jgi:hypothetical protein
MLTIYLLFRLIRGMAWSDLGPSLLSAFSLMAAGMLTKQAEQLSARFLNDVNDTVSGGAIVSLPAGISSPAVSATQAGDRIVLDDASALALSDSAVGTLYGGIYQYVQTLSTATANPARGTAAFWRATDLITASLYQVSSDAQPNAASLPTFIAGVFINAITKGNFGWIQLCGVCSVLFDSSITGAGTAGNPVSVKVNASVASTFDVAVPLAATLAGAVASVSTYVGPAVNLAAVSTISQVLWVRSPFSRI